MKSQGIRDIRDKSEAVVAALDKKLKSEDGTIAYLLGVVDGQREQLKLLQKEVDALDKQVSDIEKKMGER